MMDPELAAATALFVRPDLADVVEARRMTRWLRETDPAVEADTNGRIDVRDARIPGPTAGEEVRVRIYTPRGAETLRPVVVYFHSGAFVLGDLETEHARCLRYGADAGCVVVSVDYRLAPEHPFPEGVEDCYAALCWVAAEADSLGADPARIAVAGSSAGGGIAASLTLLARARGGPRIALQMLIYPALDDRLTTISMQTFDSTPIFDSRNSREMWRQYLRPDTIGSTAIAAPAREQDLRDLPNAYVLTAEFDPLRDEAMSYALRLLQAGVSVEFHNVAGAYHGFDHQVPDAAISRRAMEDQLFHLRRFLRA